MNKLKKCGYAFNVSPAYEKMQSTWCRRCGASVDVVVVKEIGALDVVLALLAGIAGALLAIYVG